MSSRCRGTGPSTEHRHIDDGRVTFEFLRAKSAAPVNPPSQTERLQATARYLAPAAMPRRALSTESPIATCGEPPVRVPATRHPHDDYSDEDPFWTCRPLVRRRRSTNRVKQNGECAVAITSPNAHPTRCVRRFHERPRADRRWRSGGSGAVTSSRET